VGCALVFAAAGVAFLLTMKGHPALVLAPALAVPLGLIPLAAARLGGELARVASLRNRLATRTSRALATDLAAHPSTLAPARRPVCVLCAQLTTASGDSVMAAPLEIARVLELHERRVLDAVRHLGGIVDRFDGDLVVALFGIAPETHPLSPPEASLLAAQAALEIARVSGPGVAIGLDSGEVLCGLIGAERHFRAQGEVLRRARVIARIAGRRGVAVAASERTSRDVESTMGVRTLGKEADILVFEITGERAHRAADLSDVHTIPR
jgi:class 3 adenylate cyclase